MCRRLIQSKAEIVMLTMTLRDRAKICIQLNGTCSSDIVACVRKSNTTMGYPVGSEILHLFLVLVSQYCLQSQVVATEILERNRVDTHSQLNVVLPKIACCLLFYSENFVNKIIFKYNYFCLIFVFLFIHFESHWYH